jgi:transcriptional regulator with XRE-family HTH domain
MKNLLPNYGQIIKAVRTKKGLTIGKLAILSGLTHPQISRIENQKSALTLNSAFRITHSLEMPLSSLLSEVAIGVLPFHFQKTYLNSENQFEYPCLNSSDFDTLDDLGFFSSGRATTVITTFLEYFLEKKAIMLDSEKRKLIAPMLYTYLGNKQLKSFSKISPPLPWALPDIINFRYPNEFSVENIRKIYFAGGVLFFLDVGAYVRLVRVSKGISLANLGRTVGLSHQGIKQLELQTAEKTRLVDIVNLDIALDLKGELLSIAWKVAEFYAGVHRIKTKRSDSLQPFQSFEIHGIEKLIVVSRLFQQYFPESREWLDAYRKQSNNGFNDWIR